MYKFRGANYDKIVFLPLGAKSFPPGANPFVGSKHFPFRVDPFSDGD